jgi:hypothetical protein
MILLPWCESVQGQAHSHADHGIRNTGGSLPANLCQAAEGDISSSAGSVYRCTDRLPISGLHFFAKDPFVIPLDHCGGSHAEQKKEFGRYAILAAWPSSRRAGGEMPPPWDRLAHVSLRVQIIVRFFVSSAYLQVSQE